jgi:AraC family transcriptional regulator
MDAVRKTLFECDRLQIGSFVSRPTSDVCGDIERQTLNAIVLPFAGVFSKHDGPNREVIGTPSHAVYIAADTPYRIGFPGAIGDRALTLRFGDGVAPDHLDRRSNNGPLASHGLLPARAMMLRNLLRLRLEKREADAFESEVAGLELLHMALVSVRAVRLPVRRASQLRRLRALARVREAVAAAPGEKWSLARLANVASLSPFHLCHVFRETVGTSIYDYVLRERLAQTLDAVLDGGDLTTIALDAGFASHSHFTARFRSFFGCTPVALRREADGRTLELRKIMTARRSAPILD